MVSVRCTEQVTDGVCCGSAETIEISLEGSVG
jgi:hypothetical protein